MCELQEKQQRRTFLSIEPLLGYVDGMNLSGYELIIVGAQTGTNVVIPKRDWILVLNTLGAKNIYYKNNIRKYFPELKNKNNDKTGFISKA